MLDPEGRRALIQLIRHLKDQIVDATKKLAVALNCVGIMNIQFIVRDGEVYVIEVYP